MNAHEQCFTPFKTEVVGYELPQRFTFPFYYQPHPLCLVAVKELQQHLSEQKQWQHNFGIKGDEYNDSAAAIGKMFGVLLVQAPDGQLGYLSAFSGKIADQNILPKFVPPVFDMLVKDSFFLTQQKQINILNDKLECLISAPKLKILTDALTQEKHSAEQALARQREHVVSGRKRRKAQRAEGRLSLSDNEFLALQAQLSIESVYQKNELLHIKQQWQDRINNAERALQVLTDEIASLKTQRKQLSNALQQQLFAQYRFLNVKGEEKDLSELFQHTINPIPPAGSGECAAPKLLQYAFKFGMKPLAMAEFWWGSSPKSEIRQHQNFYPACQGKCKPILTHMLDGLKVDENPLLCNPAAGKELEIVYQDDVMVVVNKPAEFLSVPGKTIADSVYTRIKEQFPQATGSLIVHRLDMSTSGLMVLGLTPRAHKSLQKQFIERSVKKHYVAMLSGHLTNQEGLITLPLRGDLNDRPRQLVCEQFGKAAETRWQVLELVETKQGKFTKVNLFPKTGRTHQLRVHCAHILGLNNPIVGDDLYGQQAERLHLHAKRLEIAHPITKQMMVFQVDENF